MLTLNVHSLSDELKQRLKRVGYSSPQMMVDNDSMLIKLGLVAISEDISEGAIEITDFGKQAISRLDTCQKDLKSH